MAAYRREWLGSDLLAALTLLAIAIPEQLAIARLADMPLITGLYAFVAGSACFALLGSNRWMSVGADSTIAPLFAVGVAGLAPLGSVRYRDLVALLAVAVGVLVIVVGLLRLGWVAEFLSAPIVTGFLAGVAVIIVIHQLPDLLGIPAAGGSSAHRLHSIAGHLGAVNVWSFGIGLAVLVVLAAVESLDRRIPAALLALISAAVVVSLVGPGPGRAPVVGSVSPQLPTLRVADVSWADLGRIMPLAGVVALVVVTQSAATARAFADEAGVGDDLNRDFLGVGTGSVAAGLLGALPVDASPPRTAAVVRAGGRSQAVSLVAAAAMAAVIPVIGLVRYVPLSALAAILIFVAVGMFHGRDLLAIARFSRFELLLAVVTMVTVAFVGVEQGIGVAVGLAVLDRARLDARPGLHTLGRVPGTTSFAPSGANEPTEEVPGVLVVLFATPLWYANAQQFQREMDAALNASWNRVGAVVLDALGMSDIDFTGARALGRVLDRLDSHAVVLAVARASAELRTGLARAGLEARIGADHFFPTVGEAVAAVPARPPVPPPEPVDPSAPGPAPEPGRRRRTST